MGGPAYAGRAVLHFCLVCFCIGDELPEVVGWEILTHGQHERLISDQRNRLEISRSVVERLLVERLVHRVSPDIAENELVAVGRRPCHAVDAGHAAGAADVFHNDRLTELAAQSLGKNAGDPIGRSPGGERYHHRDRPRRIVLRAARCRPRNRAAKERNELAPLHRAGPKLKDHRRYSSSGPFIAAKAARSCLLGSTAAMASRLGSVGFTPESGQTAEVSACPLRAISGHMHRRKRRARVAIIYSIIMPASLLNETLWKICRDCPDQSALTPANFTTLPHFSVSSAMSLPKSAGESASTWPPRSARRAFILGSARPALISVLSLSTISAGVSRGAPMPVQKLNS